MIPMSRMLIYVLELVFGKPRRHLYKCQAPETMYANVGGLFRWLGNSSYFNFNGVEKPLKHL